MSFAGDCPGCLACDLAGGRRPCPGGRIEEAAHWVVEHCVGPLGVGTLAVKSRRHVMHWVVQPVEASADPGRRGPNLQAALFDRGELLDPVAVERAADAVRAVLGEGRAG